MFASEIDGLHQQLREVRDAKQRLEDAHRERVDNIYQDDEESSQGNISTLKEEINQLREQLILEKNINSTITKKYEQELKKMNIEGITSSLENTITEITQENAKLKTKINKIEADIGSLR